jgi:hypothetical protein
MTAPLAAFPPMAPMAAPFAAPLALGWELCGVVVGGGEVVCVGGVGAGAVCAGGACASTAGTTAPQSPITRDKTLGEYFIMVSFWVRSSESAIRSGGATFLLLVIVCTAQWFLL